MNPSRLFYFSNGKVTSPREFHSTLKIPHLVTKYILTYGPSGKLLKTYSGTWILKKKNEELQGEPLSSLSYPYVNSASGCCVQQGGFMEESISLPGN